MPPRSVPDSSLAAGAADPFAVERDDPFPKSFGAVGAFGSLSDRKPVLVFRVRGRHRRILFRGCFSAEWRDYHERRLWRVA